MVSLSFVGRREWGRVDPKPCAHDTICSECFGPVTFMPPAFSCPSAQLQLPLAAGGEGVECAMTGLGVLLALRSWLLHLPPLFLRGIGGEDMKFCGLAGKGLAVRDGGKLSTWAATLMPDWSWPGWEEGEESSRWVRLCWGEAQSLMLILGIWPKAGLLFMSFCL